MRRRDAREAALPYVAKPLDEIKLGVQRLAVILPIEDQNRDMGLETDKEVTDNIGIDDNE